MGLPHTQNHDELTLSGTPSLRGRRKTYESFLIPARKTLAPKAGRQKYLDHNNTNQEKNPGQINPGRKRAEGKK